MRPARNYSIVGSRDTIAWLAGTAPARRVAEALFRVFCRRQRVHFDRLDSTRCQARILQGLLNQARSTPFGRQHDFCRIRTLADFRRLVPLGAGVRGTLLEKALDAAHRAALRTALALAADALPRAAFFT